MTNFKTANPALFNFVSVELQKMGLDIDGAEGVKVVTAIEERTALVMELRMFDDYLEMPVGTKGRLLLDAAKDKVLREIVEQECILANYGLV